MKTDKITFFLEEKENHGSTVAPAQNKTLYWFEFSVLFELK